MLKDSELVTIRTGEQVPEILMLVAIVKLKWLKQNYPNAFQYICYFCHHDDGVTPLAGQQFFAELEICMPPYGISARVKSIVKSAAVGSPGQYTLQDPQLK